MNTMYISYTSKTLFLKVLKSDEHWELYAINEFLNTTSKANNVLYVG